MAEDRHVPWWREAVVYQVYPRSFLDTNGDGIGDLPGIERRLDHLSWLGIDAVWISPFYRSPMADFGYDVSDYCDVDPLFGTLADADRLIAAAHERGIRVLVDWVPNHTSDQHPWFLESRSSRSSPKRDWYHWRDGRGGAPPNNWRAVFGGPGLDAGRAHRTVVPPPVPAAAARPQLVEPRGRRGHAPSAALLARPRRRRLPHRRRSLHRQGSRVPRPAGRARGNRPRRHPERPARTS